MSKPVWKSGPPPSLGWWPASVWGVRNPEMLGWYDGEYWSAFASINESEYSAANQAKKRGGSQDVEWLDRPANWPARSRT